MDAVLSLLLAILLASTEGTFPIKITPTVIPGDHAMPSCPSSDLLEMARQNISAKVQEIISGTSCITIIMCTHSTDSIRLIALQFFKGLVFIVHMH